MLFLSYVVDYAEPSAIRTGVRVCLDFVAAGSTAVVRQMHGMHLSKGHELSELNPFQGNVGRSASSYRLQANKPPVSGRTGAAPYAHRNKQNQNPLLYEFNSSFVSTCIR